MKKRTRPSQIQRPKAFSYARFSTPEQAKGDSLRRQTAMAATYAKRHNLDLDETLTLRDLGVSAYRGKNVDFGALGKFIEAAEAGVIKAGSYLLVESLDRISRLPALEAANLLNRICCSGIVVVTLDSERVYTEETLRDDPNSLLLAIMVAARANEESVRKGKRLHDAWVSKKARARKEIITAMAPCWLKPNADRTGWIVDKAKAKIVKRIFDLTLKGVGVNKLAMTFNEQGVPAIGRPRRRRVDAPGAGAPGKWQVTFIQKLLANPAVIGEFRDHKREYDHKTRKYTRIATGEAIKGYYPRIIDEAVYKKVAAQSASRRGEDKEGKGKSKVRTRYGRITNIFAGLSRCPHKHCRSSMSSVNKGNGSKVYLACSKAKIKAGCRQYHAVRLSDVEAAFIEAFRDTDLLRNVPTGNRSLDNQLREATQESERLEHELGIIQDAWLDSPSSFLAAEIAKTEKQKQEALARLRTLSDQIEAADHVLLEKRAQELLDVLPGPFAVIGEDGSEKPAPINREAINAVLHRIFDHVVIDYLTGNLVIHWRNGAKTRIKYGKPLKRDKAAA